MIAGKLDKRVLIKYPTSTQNAVGEPVVTWNTLETCWCSVYPLRGRELFTARQFLSEVDTKFIFRYSTITNQIKPNWKLTYRDLDYDIESVINSNDDSREILVMCKRVTT